MHVDEGKNKQLMKGSCKCATLLYSKKEGKKVVMGGSLQTISCHKNRR